MSQIVKPDFIQEYVSLKPHNSFRFDATARFYGQITHLYQLDLAVKWANANRVSICMLGEGSNLLLTGDLDALVLINNLKGIALSQSENFAELTVSAGESWHQVVTYAVDNSFAGIENLALIPGSAGAAPVQNIGAYGVEVKDTLARVQVFDRSSGELLWIDAKECGFAYRDSHFKGIWADKYFITAICLKLDLDCQVKVSYGGLAEGLPSQPSIKQVFDRVCEVRTAKLPDPKMIGNAGSFFKNPIVTNDEYQKIHQSYPDLVAFAFEGRWKLAAGWMIDKAGWKGVSQDGVGVYEKQALCLVNHSADRADSLLKLEQDIKLDIKQKFGVVLEREPVQLGKVPLI